MPVPKAAVDKDDGAIFWQDEVGSAGQRFVFRPIHREAVTKAVEHRAQGELRFGVASADARHDFGALFGGEDVHVGEVISLSVFRDGKPCS